MGIELSPQAAVTALSTRLGSQLGGCSLARRVSGLPPNTKHFAVWKVRADSVQRAGIAQHKHAMSEGKGEGGSSSDAPAPAAVEGGQVAYACDHNCGFKGSYETVVTHEACCKGEPSARYGCDNGCGFSGDLQTVAQHEGICSMNSDANSSSPPSEPQTTAIVDRAAVMRTYRHQWQEDKDTRRKQLLAEKKMKRRERARVLKENGKEEGAKLVKAQGLEPIRLPPLDCATGQHLRHVGDTKTLQCYALFGTPESNCADCTKELAKVKKVLASTTDMHCACIIIQALMRGVMGREKARARLKQWQVELLQEIKQEQKKPHCCLEFCSNFQTQFYRGLDGIADIVFCSNSGKQRKTCCMGMSAWFNARGQSASVSPDQKPPQKNQNAITKEEPVAVTESVTGVVVDKEPARYGCDHGCGFSGDLQTVAHHEAVCPMKPDAKNSSSFPAAAEEPVPAKKLETEPFTAAAAK